MIESMADLSERTKEKLLWANAFAWLNRHPAHFAPG